MINKVKVGDTSHDINDARIGTFETSLSSNSNTSVPSSKAVADYVSSQMTSVLTYKGTIGSSGATVTALPASHKVGDVYVVATTGTYAGKAVEVGDYIICKTAGTSANNAHWDVVNGENQVENKSASLAAAGSSATIATIDGTDITVTTPSTWKLTDTNTKVTSAANHYAPSADANSELTAAISGTAGTYAINTEYTVLTGVKAQRDAKGHVTGLTYTAQKVKDTNTTPGSLITNATTAQTASSGEAMSGNITLHKVSKTGSYNDLNNKPTIPAAVDENTVSGWGFTKNAGTITGITMNGASKGTSGVVDLGTVITAHQSLSAYEPRYPVNNQSSSSFTAAVDNYYRFASNVGTMTITLPAPSDSYTHSIFFKFTTGSSPAVTFTSSKTIIYYSDFAIKASKTYEVNALYNGTEWIVAFATIA